MLPDTPLSVGLHALGQPRLTSIYDAVGTRDSGYAETGPYSCARCIHKTHPDAPFCIHPKVIGDDCMQDRLVQIDGRPAVKIDLATGCCEYVHPPTPAHAEPDEDDRHPFDDATGKF